MRILVSQLLAVCLLTLSGCSLLESEKSGPEMLAKSSLEPDTLIITTDASTYVRTDTVGLTVSNGLDKDVWLMSAGCRTVDDKRHPELSLEKRENNSWSQANNSECAIAVAQSPVRIESGRARTVYLKENVLDDPLGDGYRYIVDIRWTDNEKTGYDQLGDKLPVERRRSSEFSLTE